MFIDAEEKKSILVIDPDPHLRNHLDEMFNGSSHASLKGSEDTLSYIFDGCSQSDEAIQKIQLSIDEDSPYELVFIESQIENGCGLALISQLWHADPDLHVVLCSSDPNLSWQTIDENLGESDQLLILQKPFSDLELRQIVHAIIRKSQLNKQSQNVMKFMELQIDERTKEIEEANQNLLQSEKMASIGQLAAGVAHEINNPLGYIYSNLNPLKQYIADLIDIADSADNLAGLCQSDHPVVLAFEQLKKRIDLDFLKNDIKDLVDESLEGSERAKQIVQDLRDFSRLDRKDREPFDLEAGLDATLNIVSNEVKYKAKVIKEYAGLRPVECIGAQLNQVFMNLLVNAAQAIDNFGQITIRTGYENNGWLWVEIEDDGKGMNDETKAKIFDPFFTTKPVGKGTGLGLSLSYKMVANNNGKIDVDSTPGIGTRFRISLPIDSNTASASETGEP
jgi:signal transduction histidine kinase